MKLTLDTNYVIQITIIIPTYNRGAPLQRALKSIIERDFSCSDYEILLVDTRPRITRAL